MSSTQIHELSGLPGVVHLRAPAGPDVHRRNAELITSSSTTESPWMRLNRRNGSVAPQLVAHESTSGGHADVESISLVTIALHIDRLLPSARGEAPAPPPNPFLPGTAGADYVPVTTTAQESAAHAWEPVSPQSSYPATPVAASAQGPLGAPKKQELTVILVGETGVGKTTFMSLLANVGAGRDLHNLALQHDPDNDTKLDASQSQTKAAMLYEITRHDGVRLRVLDTPGLCDTRGIEQDSEHKASIARAIREHVAQVDAVLVMANGTNTRLTVPTDYALNTLSAMFPASIASNIGFLFTHVESPLSFNFQPSSLPKPLRNAELFAIQNPLALLVKYQDMLLAPQPPPSKKQKIYERMLRSSYADALETVNEIFRWLDELQPRPTAEISDLYDLATGIESVIADVLARLNQMEARRLEIARLRADLEKSKQTMKINEQFEKIMQLEMHVQVDTPDQHTTQCTVAGCYSNCHEGCKLEFLLDPAELGNRCSAFAGSRERHPSRAALEQRCVQCGHNASEHRHFHSVWGLSTKKERVVDEGARLSYQSAEQDAASYRAQMQRMEKTLRAFDADISKLETRLAEHCDAFQQIALTGNFAGHISATIRMLKFRRDAKSKVGDEDSANVLTKTIESMERKVAVIREMERKKKESWNLTRLAQGVGQSLRP